MADPRRADTLRIVSSVLALAYACAFAAPSSAADEVWSGTYRCGEMASDAGRSDGYTSSIRMIVQGSTASISKESPQIRETLSGEIADGGLRLEGTGRRKESASPGWRYRFDGKFDGERFDARGMMFSANLASKLRDCTMTLRRVSGGSAAARHDARAATAQPKPAGVTPPQSLQTAAAAPTRTESPPARGGGAAAQAVQNALDVRDRDHVAIVEGTVQRGVPHRYLVTALKGQRVSATMKSEAGARFDLYEPGSALTTLSNGFVVQGARVGGSGDGTRLDVELPADGQYLLVVRSGGDDAFYTLELKSSRGVLATTAQRWSENRYVWIALMLGALALIGAFAMRRKRERRLFRPD